MLCNPDWLWCCLPIANRSLFLPDCSVSRVGNTSPSSFRPQPAQLGAPLNLDRRCPPPTDPMGSVPAVQWHFLQPVPRCGILTSVLTLPKMRLCRAERRGGGIWYLAMENVHVARAWPAGWEEVPLCGGHHPLSLVAQIQPGKAEACSSEIKLSAVCEQGAEPSSPGPWATYLYLCQTERCCSFGRLS